MEVFTNPKDVINWIVQNSKQDCRILCVDSLTYFYFCDIRPTAHQSLYQSALNKKYFSPLIFYSDCSSLFIIPDWEYKKLKSIVPFHINVYESNHLVFACKGKSTKALYELMKFFH